MNYTSNMGMNMPDENDKFSIEHFNTNTQTLDIVGKPDEYKNTKTYAVGDLCIHNNILYKCIIAVETAEEFNAEKWEVTSLCKEEIANKTAIAELNENMVPNYNNMSTLYQGNSDIITQVTTINKDGWLQCVAKTAAASGMPFIRLYINNVMVYEKTGITSNYSYAWSPLFRVKKGDIIKYTLTTETSDGLKELRFYLQ